MTGPVLSDSSPHRASLLRRIRGKLGTAKYVLLDGGHRDVRYKMRNARLIRQAERLLDRMARQGRIRPLAIPAQSECEVHTFCGHNYVTMGIWSLMSFLRFAEGRIALVIHSDGTMTAADIERFRRFFPNVHVLLPDESRVRVKKRLAGGDFQYLEHFYSNHQFAPKFLAPHTSEGVRTIIMMDTDILFFRRPDEVLDQVFNKDGLIPVSTFYDEFDWLATVTAHQNVEAACGTKIIPHINAGMVVISRFSDEHYHFVERNLQAFTKEWREHYFAEQMSLALVAGTYGWNELSRNKYRIASIDPKADEGQDWVAVHYVTNRAIRPRFFTEGLPRLVRTLEATHPT